MQGDILCLPTSVVQQWTGGLQGFRNVPLEDFVRLLNYRRYIPRPTAELDVDYKQVIPYVLVPHGEHEDVFLSYERGKAGAEARLHGKTALGLGGHVEDGETVVCAAQREVNEEVKGMGKFSLSFVGLVNEDESEVGKVHLGAVYIAHRFAPFMDISAKENGIRKLGWAHLTDLYEWGSQGMLEAWAEICVDNIDRILPTPTTPTK